MARIDAFLSAYAFREAHVCAVAAPPRAVIAAVAAYRPETDPFFRAMIGLRELPMRAARRASAPPPFGLHSFTLLEKTDDALVYGLAGRFWRPDFGLAPVADADAFLAFGEPGVPKLALGFSAVMGPDGMTRLGTETRVFCPDAASRLKFAPYWYLIRPVSGLIRARILAAVKRASEGGR